MASVFIKSLYVSEQLFGPNTTIRNKWRAIIFIYLSTFLVLQGKINLNAELIKKEEEIQKREERVTH